MAAPQEASAADGAAAAKTEPPVQVKVQVQPPETPKKLSNAEIKAQKQAEKAKRRAAVIKAKEAAAAAPGSGSGPGAAGAAAPAASSGAKAGKAKQGGGPEAGAGGKGAPTARRPSAGAGPRPAVSAAAAAATAAATAATPSDKSAEADPRSQIPECFSHLPMAKRISVSQAHKDVHPAVLVIGQQMATFALRDNVARVEATMLAFKKVIESYETPSGTAFSRHFVSHVLNPQIEYLTECRPMCFGMGNAIRLLKGRVSQLDLDMDDRQAIEFLCDSIDTFIQERIRVAEVAIARNAADLIADGDSILTLGNARLVRAAVELAWARGARFSITILDDPYDATGAELARYLRGRLGPGHVAYHPHLGGLEGAVRAASKVFLGAEALFANGSLLGPSGTCDVAVAAAALGRPVVALCETVNLDRDRVAVDSLGYNEIDPERCSAAAFRLLFDTTRDRHVSVLVTEYEEGSGCAPSQAIQQILRTKEEMN